MDNLKIEKNKVPVNHLMEGVPYLV
jgi:hypothetical protein